MTTITLSNPGNRVDVVKEDAAKVLLDKWKAQLGGASVVVVETLDLQCRSYEPSAAKIIRDFLLEEKLVSNIKVVWMNDIIASLPTAKGLEVLEIFSGLLKDAPIERLSLSDNALGIRGIKACQEMLSVPTIKELSLENDGLNMESMKVLAKVMTTKTTPDKGCVCDILEKFRIYNNMIGVEGAEATGTILSKCRSLREFRYEGCRPLGKGSAAIAQGLFQMCQDHPTQVPLEKLYLEGSFGPSSDDNPLKPLCQALSKVPHLTHLRLGDCSLESSGTTAVTKALLKNKAQIISLELPQNEVTSQNIRTMIPLIQENLPTLEVLNLDSNELTSIGVERLMEAFSYKNVLQQLKLNENSIGSRGACALIKANSTLPALEELHLDVNGFPEAQVEELEKEFGGKLQPMDENETDDMDEYLEEEDDDDDDEDGDGEESEGGAQDKGKEEKESEEEGDAQELTQNFRKLTPDDVSL